MAFTNGGKHSLANNHLNGCNVKLTSVLINNCI